MSAGAQYNKSLNMDAAGIKTPVFYDTDIDDWIMYAALLMKNSAGKLTIPILDPDGYLRASIKNSALPTGAATEATLASILAKIIASPATETTLASILTQLGTTGLKKIIDPLPTGTNKLGGIDVLTSVLPTGSSSIQQGTVITGNGAAQRLSDLGLKEVLIQAHPNNTNFVYVGNSTVSPTAYVEILTPSSKTIWRVSNSNLLYVYAVTGDKVSYGGEG